MVNPHKAYPIDPSLIPIYERVNRDNFGHSLETAVPNSLELIPAIQWFLDPSEN